MSGNAPPRRGEVWWVRVDKRRPAIVVQTDKIRDPRVGQVGLLGDKLRHRCERRMFGSEHDGSRTGLGELFPVSGIGEECELTFTGVLERVDLADQHAAVPINFATAQLCQLVQ